VPAVVLQINEVIHHHQSMTSRTQHGSTSHHRISRALPES
jgi:hypothetical protein